jgi:hypothetical protein
MLSVPLLLTRGRGVPNIAPFACRKPNDLACQAFVERNCQQPDCPTFAPCSSSTTQGTSGVYHAPSSLRAEWYLQRKTFPSPLPYSRASGHTPRDALAHATLSDRPEIAEKFNEPIPKPAGFIDRQTTLPTYHSAPQSRPRPRSYQSPLGRVQPTDRARSLDCSSIPKAGWW